MRLLPRLREEFRQRRHHRAFRIPPPLWDETVQDLLDRLLAASDPAAPEPASPLDEKALATAATNLWRAERKLAQQGKDATSRQAGRYLRTTRGALSDAGLVVQDHDGETFHSGRAIEVLLFQDDPSLSVETVLETVRPSIYLGDRHIQMGQVIVGCPPRDHVRNEYA
ncbi:hypothetical protein AB0K12_17850 [Nonomuraea sp. NPDC049419]|uniref:hypothetical protein n=1 Tax=unclassified Nonomuraea TaxID=2593643 RepID=UPI00341B6467